MQLLNKLRLCIESLTIVSVSDQRQHAYLLTRAGQEWKHFKTIPKVAPGLFDDRSFAGLFILNLYLSDEVPLALGIDV